MLHDRTTSIFSQIRLQTFSEANKRALKDAIIVATLCVAAWILIERTEACTRFFRYVAANPDMEIDSIILAGIFSAVGVLVFALRRWTEAARAERRSNALAYHDPLTGLPNRRAFMEGLQHATEGGGPFACLLFDLDDFKKVNDLRGHFVGDRLLQTVSERLANFLSNDVLLARIGGDEFALLFALNNPEHELNLPKSIVQLVSEPLLLDGHSVQVRVSVGIARFPDDADGADALLRKADIALYRAKARGCGAIQSFEPSMEETDRRHAAVAEALRGAIPRREIVPHYQPLIELATGDVIGFEVLSRWESPILGTVAPGEFVPIAMDAGLISDLCWQVLEQACTDAVHWPQPLRISFNVAPRQLCDPILPLQLLAILSKTGLPPQRLEIEMTEEALLANDRTARTNLEVLKGQGITLALDDFGTGYSSLHHLRTLSFDKVKIDRSYIAKIVSCGKSRRMIEAIIKFTNSLAIPVLAEGVETMDQARILKELGCDLAQGWLYGKAVPNSELEKQVQGSAPAVPLPAYLRLTA